MSKVYAVRATPETVCRRAQSVAEAAKRIGASESAIRRAMKAAGLRQGEVVIRLTNGGHLDDIRID